MSSRVFVSAFFVALILAGGGCFSSSVANIDVRVPEDVIDESSDFPIDLTIENTSGDTLRVHTVTVSDGLYKGLLFGKSVPEETVWDINEVSDYVLEYAGLSIEPKESMEINLTLNAFLPGNYGGTVDVCFEGIEECLINPVTITVE